MVVAGTYIDVSDETVKQSDEQFNLVSSLKCFSIVSNGGNLFGPNSGVQHKWLDGVRAVLMMLILVGHLSVRAIIPAMSPISPFTHIPLDFHVLINELISCFFSNSTFLVKSFFLIG